MPGILVGVDGSDHSRQALTWAIHEAAQRQVPLTVLAVRVPAARPATQIFWNVPTLKEDEHDRDVARAGVQTWVDKVVNETGETAADVRVEVVTGDPAEELIKASRDADLLVVGSRGSGGFARLLLGSVSSKVMHHAARPTVVVRGASLGPRNVQGAREEWSSTVRSSSASSRPSRARSSRCSPWSPRTCPGRPAPCSAATARSSGC